MLESSDDLSPAQKRAQLEKATRELVALGESNEAFQREYSRQLFARFVTLREAGFSEAQAFLVVQSRGLT